MNYLYDQSYAGAVYNATNGDVYYPSVDGLFHTALFLDGDHDVTLTGYYTRTSGGNVYYQTTSGWWILGNNGSKWTTLDQRRTIKTYNAADAQKLVDKIIANNKHIICNNILCARFSYKLSESEKQTLYGLQTRLQRRNEALQDKGLVTNIQTSYPTGYADVAGYLTSFMNQQNGVGIAVSTTAIIVVSCIVIASLGAAAYFAYKAFATESQDDVRFSDELTATLASRLTEEEYQQLMDETQGIVTKSRIKQTLSTSKNLIAAGLIGLGVLMLMNIWRGGTLRR